MKRTTMALDERVLKKIRKRAEKEGLTAQEYTNNLLVLALEKSTLEGRAESPLPVYNLGKASVDISDREELLDVLDKDQ